MTTFLSDAVTLRVLVPFKSTRTIGRVVGSVHGTRKKRMQNTDAAIQQCHGRWRREACRASFSVNNWVLVFIGSFVIRAHIE
jgi:hypothetical protein